MKHVTIITIVSFCMLSTLSLLFMDIDAIYGMGIHTAANGIAFDSTHDRMYLTGTNHLEIYFLYLLFLFRRSFSFKQG